LTQNRGKDAEWDGRGRLSPEGRPRFVRFVAQQSTNLIGVIDFNMKHRIGQLQFSTRRFSSVDGSNSDLKSVDNRHEPFGGGRSARNVFFGPSSSIERAGFFIKYSF